MRVLVFVLPKWAESRFQTKFVGTHGRKLITKFEWKISGNFAKYFAQCHLGIGITFKFNAMGNFQLAGEREEKRNYLGSTWKWIADRVKSRTEEALDTMAEGKGDMKLKLEIQMQIETDKRLVNPKQPTRWPLMVFLRFIEEILSRRTDSLDNLAACWKWNVWKWLIKCGYNFSISSPASSTSITLLAFTCCRGKEYFAIYFFIWAWDFGFGFGFGFLDLGFSLVQQLIMKARSLPQSFVFLPLLSSLPSVYWLLK